MQLEHTTAFDVPSASEAYNFSEEYILDFIFGDELPDNIEIEILRLEKNNSIFKERLEAYRNYITVGAIKTKQEYLEISIENADLFSAAFTNAISQTEKEIQDLELEFGLDKDTLRINLYRKDLSLVSWQSLNSRYSKK